MIYSLRINTDKYLEEITLDAKKNKIDLKNFFRLLYAALEIEREVGVGTGEHWQWRLLYHCLPPPPPAPASQTPLLNE